MSQEKHTMKKNNEIYLIAAAATVAGAYLWKRSAKAKSGSARVFFTHIETEAASRAATALGTGCAVISLLQPEAVSAWQAAVTRLAAEYPMVTFIGTDAPQSEKQLKGMLWFVQVGENINQNPDSYAMYMERGNDLDQLALELENAALHCTGAM